VAQRTRNSCGTWAESYKHLGALYANDNCATPPAELYNKERTTSRQARSARPGTKYQSDLALTFNKHWRTCSEMVAKLQEAALLDRRAIELSKDWSCLPLPCKRYYRRDMAVSYNNWVWCKAKLAHSAGRTRSVPFERALGTQRVAGVLRIPTDH